MMRRSLVLGWLSAMACSGGDAPQSIPVRDVTVSAPVSSLVVGTTAQLSAQVNGADGNVIQGASVAWTSLTPAILSVSASGVATALQAGQGTVRAASGGKSGDLSLLVKNPPVAALSFDRDSVIITLPGSTTTLLPNAKDASGRAIVNPTVFYASDAPKVATVTQLGVVTAVAAGVAVISVTADAASASVRVRVNATTTATSPRITGVTPLVAGGSAVVSGSNFASSVNGNAVLIEGIAATVTAATTTQLNITLPATGWACSSVRPVSLQVNANNETGVATASLRTAVSRSLAVGQSLVLSTASDARCNELAGTGGTYLVTAYNVARVQSGGDASFALRGAATVASTASAVADAVSRPARVAFPDVPAVGSARFGRWLERAEAVRAEATHADIMARSLEFARAAGSPLAGRRRMRASADAAVAASLRAVQQVTTLGAVTTLKIPNLDAQSFCTSSIAIGARTAWVGQHAVIVEDTTTSISGVPTLKGQLDSLYAQVGQEFDTVMWPILTTSFGNPLAMDKNLSSTGKIVMVFSPRVNAMAGGTVEGFVASCDFYPVSQSPSSNFGEYFYAIVPTTMAAGSGSGTREAWLRHMRGTLIHEAKHITSFGERLSRSGASFEELWLEEGLARHAEEQFARGIYGVPWKANTGYAASVYCDVLRVSATPQCPSHPILMLRHFDALYTYLLTPEPFSVLGRTAAGDATFYGTGWSMARWAMDQYAASESAFLLAMVQSTQSGIANLEARVGSAHPWEEMLGEWALSFYTDDYPGVTFANARLQYPSWNFRDEFRGLCNDFGPCLNANNTANAYPVAFPLAPKPVSFGAFSSPVTGLMAGSFSAWLLSGAQSAPQLLDLRGTNGGEPPAQVRLAIVRLQ